VFTKASTHEEVLLVGGQWRKRDTWRSPSCRRVRKETWHGFCTQCLIKLRHMRRCLFRRQINEERSSTKWSSNTLDCLAHYRAAKGHH
jgi:hypothetical protein